MKCPVCNSSNLEEDKDFSCIFTIWYDCLECKHTWQEKRKEPLFVNSPNKDISDRDEN